MWKRLHVLLSRYLVSLWGGFDLFWCLIVVLETKNISVECDRNWPCPHFKNSLSSWWFSTCSGYRELASSKHVFHIPLNPCCVCVNSKNTCFMYLVEQKNSGNFSNLFFCHWLVIRRILYLRYEAKIHFKIIAECEFWKRILWHACNEKIIT